ncbi:hypothetical protein AURDEDRAFT_163735 [Auricularia subglabra TFB-10046 SS5]|nr:hypothetical protein AURDEDRAFT_163735 [Auricularia subglabra TFB-10046 SS5]
MAPICGRWATTFYNGRSVRVQIEDRCISCHGGDLDLSEPAFVALAGSLDVGRLQGVTWALD